MDIKDLVIYRNLEHQELFRDIAHLMGYAQVGELPGYNELVYKNLSKIVGFEMHQAKMDGEVIEDSALFDGSANNDGLMFLLSVLKAIACAGGRIGNDLYVFSSGPRTGIGEFILPSIAPGSSIMPGKLNPYMPELLLQIMQQVISHEHVATLTINESDLDLCSSTCASFMGAMESLELIEKGFRLFTDLCLKGIDINRDRHDEMQRCRLRMPRW